MSENLFGISQVLQSSFLWNNTLSAFPSRSVVVMDTKWHFLWKISPKEAFELQSFGISQSWS